jgi:hypothetical protein
MSETNFYQHGLWRHMYVIIFVYQLSKMHFFLSFFPFAIIFLPLFLSDTRWIPQNPSPPSRRLFLKIRRFSPQERPPAQCRKSAFWGLYLIDCDRVSQMFHKYAADFS